MFSAGPSRGRLPVAGIAGALYAEVVADRA
jgi:hypothetical protein